MTYFFYVMSFTNSGLDVHAVLLASWQCLFHQQPIVSSHCLGEIVFVLTWLFWLSICALPRS